jgi:hypothetical protein
MRRWVGRPLGDRDDEVDDDLVDEICVGCNDSSTTESWLAQVSFEGDLSKEKYRGASCIVNLDGSLETSIDISIMSGGCSTCCRGRTSL